MNEKQLLINPILSEFSADFNSDLNVFEARFEIFVDLVFWGISRGILVRDILLNGHWSLL